MSPVQYRVERNPLTKHGSYKLRFFPQQIAGHDKVAPQIATDEKNIHPLGP